MAAADGTTASSPAERVAGVIQYLVRLLCETDADTGHVAIPVASESVITAKTGIFRLEIPVRDQVGMSQIGCTYIQSQRNENAYKFHFCAQY